MRINTYRAVCLTIFTSIAVLVGCHHEHHDRDHDEIVTYDQDHHYEHHGYYDDHHDWQGGYYDEHHDFHDDPHDFHSDRR